MFLTATKTNKALGITQEILSLSAGYEGQQIKCIYEGWNFNSGTYLFTTDTE